MARKDLPAPGAPNFLQRVREELHALLGKTGSASDRALTLREALETGVLVPGPGGSLVPGGGTGGGGTTVVEYEPDLTPPPQPGSFTATPAISHILIEQAAPFYTQGHGHGRTVVYGAQVSPALPNPVFADAVEIGRFAGTIWGMVSNPATTWRLWIKWESVDGVLSTTPSGGTNGVEATTGQDPSALLEVLAGQITTAELASSLSTPIGQIPGMLADILSNADAIAQEALDRAAAVTAEASARTNALAIEASAREDADDALQQQIDLISAASSGDLSALIDAVNQERDARILDVLDAENAAALASSTITTALAAEVTARGIADGALASANAITAAQAAGLSGGLAAEVSARSLADGVIASSSAVTASHASGAVAAVATERQIRATADTALATTSTGLAASIGQAAAAVVSEASARSTADSAQAQAQATVAAQVAQTSAAVVSLQTASASADAAQASQIASLSASAQNTSAALQTEQTVRAAQDASLASVTTLLGANVGSNAAAISTEASTRATADSAQAAATSTLGASVAGALSAIQTEALVRASADAAQASTSTTLAASMGQSVAALQVEASTRATADTAQAGYQTTLAAQTAANAAAVVSVQQAFTSADAAQAGQISSIAVSTAQAAAALQVESQVRATDDMAQVTRSDAMAAQIGASASAIQSEQATRATQDMALAQQTQIMSVALGTNQAVIQTEATTRADADAAQASVVSVLATRMGDNVAGIVTEQAVRSAQDSALAQSITTTQAATGANIAAISVEQTSRTTADTALATQVNVVGAATSDNAARIRTEETTRATQDAALASRNDALTAASANAVSSVITEQQARTSADNALAAQTSSMLAMVGANAAGILAEQSVRSSADAVQAQSSQVLYALHGSNAAAVKSEESVRATADTANAARIATVGAELGAASAAIRAEETARVTQDAAQASVLSGLTAQMGQARADIVDLSEVVATNNEARATDISALRAQMVGGYTGTDLESVASGLLFQERNARAAEDSALAQQITLLSAGAGEQFDYSNIWYFDTGADGWLSSTTGDYTFNTTGGWISVRANTGTIGSPFISSPTTLLSVLGSKYTQVKLRIRKVGSPTWRGRILFRTAADSVFNTAQYAEAAEPVWDAATGVAVVTWNMPEPWLSSTNTRIRLDISTNIMPGNYHEVDWVAIGRPSPGASSAQLTAEQVARADGDSAQATARETLAAQIRGGYTGNALSEVTTGLLFQEREARATADATEVTQRETLSTKLTGQANPASLTIETLASGLLFDEKTARLTADASQVTRIESLEVFKTSAEGSISGTASALSTLTGTVATISGGLDAQVNASNLLLARIDGGNLANFAPYHTWEFTTDHAQWSVVTSSVTLTATANSLIVEQLSGGGDFRTANITTAWAFNGARYNKVRMRVRKLAGTGGWRGRLMWTNAVTTAFSTAYQHLAPDTGLTVGGPWKVVEWDLEAPTSGGSNWIDNTTTGLRFGLGNAIGDRFEIDWIAVGSRSAGVTQAALETEASVRATQTGELYAQYTVKTDVGGLISGYGLASSANNAAPTSAFGIQAGQFFVAPPAVASTTAPTENLFKGFVWRDTVAGVNKYWTGSVWSTTPQSLPFVIQTVPQVINGETVQPGVYMDNLFMARLVATRGQIGLLAVDDARIANMAVDKLVAGSLAVGQYAQSTGYVAGSAGWRINGDGTAEFSGVVVRGTIFASQGAIGGWNIGSNYLQSTTYVLGTSGTRFNSDGTGQIGGITIYSEGLGAGSTAYDTGNGAWIGRDGKFSLKSATSSLKWDGYTLQINGGGTFSGDLSAATGTFAGALSAATGTFSGTLTASAVNAVNTINLAGQAVTIPVGAYSSGLTPAGSFAQTATIVSTGAPIVITASVVISNNQENITWSLRRNEAVIYQGPSIYTPNPLAVAFTIIDNPGAGSHTYALVASSNSYNRALVLLEVKK